MATQLVSVAPYNTTDALFRDWGSQLSAAFETLGFTKTADTGQIDWATVLHPTANNQMMGYEIRQFTDDLQAQTPVIVKVEYGSGTNGASNIGLTLTVGKASDGIGNLIGSAASPIWIYTSGGSNDAKPFYVSSDGGRINFGVGNITAASVWSIGFSIERFKDNSGVPTNAGVNIVAFGPSFKFQQCLPRYGSSFPNVIQPGLCCMAPYTGTGSYDGNIGLFPVHSMRGYTDNPDLGCCVYCISDIATNTGIDLTILGASHHYVALGFSIGAINGNTGQTFGVALRYE